MKPLTIETMRAAEVLLHHGESLAVVYVKPSGVTMDCMLSGRGEDRYQALLTVTSNERLHYHEVPFERVLLPAGVEGRLESISKTQRRQDRIGQAAREHREAVPC